MHGQVEIPEIGFEPARSGTLGGRYTTIEGAILHVGREAIIYH